MRGAELDLTDLSASLLQKLHSTSPPPRLFGWPSPLRRVTDEAPIFHVSEVVNSTHNWRPYPQIRWWAHGLDRISFILLLLIMQIFATSLIDVEVPPGFG